MKTLIFFASLSFCSMTFAGTIFEPSLSVGQGNGDVSGVIGTTNVTAEGSGTIASGGFRYGITRRYIHVTGIFEGTILAGQGDTVFTGMMGLGLGYEWNIPLRTYLFAAAWDFDTDLIGGGAEIAYMITESMWLGLRFSNFKTENQGVLNNIENVDLEFNLSTVSVVLSFPIEFTYPDHWFRKTDWE